LGFEDAKDEISKVFDEIDNDKSGMIELTEFMRMIQSNLVDCVLRVR